MLGWQASVDGVDPRSPTAPIPPQQPASEPNGLLGRLLEYQRTDRGY
jgi:hypothetical protein